jgi:hypothetical protein
VYRSDDGFQLGNKGNVLFDELVELISYYMGNSFMNDDFGYPLMLRTPKAQVRLVRLRVCLLPSQLIS